MRSRVVGLIAAVVVLGIFPCSALAGRGPEVRVIGEDNQTVALFKSAKCTKGKHFFHAEALSTDGASELDAFIHNFSGFHDYDLELGSTERNLVFQSKQAGTPVYSNEFAPPFPVPGFGKFTFLPKGKRMGMGFGPVMWSNDFSTGVVIAGALECKYPKKKKK
jgi:hypothetical protein